MVRTVRQPKSGHQFVALSKRIFRFGQVTHYFILLKYPNISAISKHSNQMHRSRLPNWTMPDSVAEGEQSYVNRSAIGVSQNPEKMHMFMIYEAMNLRYLIKFTNLENI
jgi:hypothetical protein